MVLGEFSPSGLYKTLRLLFLSVWPEVPESHRKTSTLIVLIQSYDYLLGLAYAP